jgi:hypothetical protein
MDIEVKINKNESVLDIINDKIFISRWEEIASQNEKVTVIQEPPFVTTWYRQYYNKYQPVLILGFDKNSVVVGIMPLAFSLKDQYLTHAGDGQAEYHGWLCTKDAEEVFPIKALIAIRNNFKLRQWPWRPIPPRSQIGWLSSKELKKEKIYVFFNKEESPVLDLNDEIKISKIRKNKSIQIKLNRYKKKNNFFIERIKSKEKAKIIFDILSLQCDFRQMAIHQTAPFAQDENKKPFYIERLNFPENNHFTVLWADDSPVAFHFGACDSDTVFLGLSSYNPIEEKNSPGSILIIKLIELLKSEGYRYLDLTPGKDKYKQKYSSFLQNIYTPTIYFFRKDKIISDVKYLIKETMKKCIKLTGGQPDVVREKLGNAFSKLKRNLSLAPGEIIRKLITLPYKKKVYFLYRLLTNDLTLNFSQPEYAISINNFSDLLLYNNSNPNIEKKADLFSLSLKHFSSEDILYTIVSGGILAQYGWMAKGGGSFAIDDIDTSFDTPVNSYILSDFFTEPNLNNQDLYSKTLEKMLVDCKKNGATEVFIAVDQNDLSSRSIIEKTGFKVFRTLQETYSFGMVYKKEY